MMHRDQRVLRNKAKQKINETEELKKKLEGHLLEHTPLTISEHSYWCNISSPGNLLPYTVCHVMFGHSKSNRG